MSDFHVASSFLSLQGTAAAGVTPVEVCWRHWGRVLKSLHPEPDASSSARHRRRDHRRGLLGSWPWRCCRWRWCWYRRRAFFVGVVLEVSCRVIEFVARLRQADLCLVMPLAVGVMISAGLLVTKPDDLFCEFSQRRDSRLLFSSLLPSLQFVMYRYGDEELIIVWSVFVVDLERISSRELIERAQR